jgi:hypothetical protein
MIVYAAIDLDDQAGPMTDKINDVRPEWRLPTKMRSVQIELS